MDIVLKYLTIALASTLKFFGGPITGIAMGINWIETALCSTVGMMFTIVIGSTLAQEISKLRDRFRKSPKKIFSRTSRTAVKIWKKFGIIGIAFLTPVLFTPPLGAILIVAFRIPRAKAYLWMLISAILWGLAVSFSISRFSIFQ
jgi:uncharacterized membrane protein